jgi:hypothetical protein
VSATGTGLAEARQLYELLQLVDGKLDQLEAKAQRTSLSVSRAIVGVTTMLQIVQRLSGDEDLDAAIGKMIRLIQIANMLRTTMLVMTASAGPWGLLFAGISAIGTVFTAGDLIGSLV